jgi:catechol 2,3-dioxygenase-like lactoylglutathione lyase family enzyme
MNSFRHVGFYINDLEKSVQFFLYFGYVICYNMIEDWGDDLGVMSIIKMKNKDGNIIELLQTELYSEPTNCHIALTVENLDLVYRDLEQYNFLVRPRLSPDGSAKVAFCEDPNGIIVELVQIL